jgi:hypothetical protein
VIGLCFDVCKSNENLVPILDSCSLKMQHALSKEGISTTDFRNDEAHRATTTTRQCLGLKVGLISDLLYDFSYPVGEVGVNRGNFVNKARDG